MAADDGSTPPDSAAGQGLVTRIGADHALTVEILAVLAGTALMLGYVHHRRSSYRRRSARARRRRHRAHARPSSVTRTAAYATAGNGTSWLAEPAAGGDPWMALPPRQSAVPPRPAAVRPRPGAGRPPHVDDHPSWPGRPGPYALHPDHPSWPGRPDPRWAATEAALRADGYPGWPAQPPPPWRDARPPADGGEPGWPGGAGPAARREPPPAVRRAPYRPPAAQAAPVLAVTVRPGSAPHGGSAARADTAPRAVIRPGPGPARQESPAGVIDRVRPGGSWVQPERVRVWDAGSVELATWIISEANQQAADIRHEARDQMAASLADAKQEATDLVRNASEQATATLAAAESEAAEIRAAVTKLSAELGGVAAQVTENLVGFVAPGTKPLTRPAAQPVATPTPEPVTEPEARPAAKPGTKPETRPTAKPAGQPGARPATKPGTKPAPKPGARPAGRAKGKPRQLRAIRVAAAATAALFLFAVGSGAMELVEHGFSFFVFRETGTGETGPSAPTDQQFLAQEAAAKAAAQRAHTPGHQPAKSTSG